MPASHEISSEPENTKRGPSGAPITLRESTSALTMPAATKSSARANPHGEARDGG